MSKKLLILIFLPSFVFAQINTRWYIKADKKLSKKIILSAQFQIREQGFEPKIDRYMGVVGLTFDLPKKFSVSGNYRYFTSYRPNKDDYKPRHRFYVDLMYGFKPKKEIELSFRSRYQNQFDDKDGGLESEESFIRNKIQNSFPSKSKLTPYLSADFFYEIGKNGLDMVRLKAGTAIKINKRHSINIGFFGNQKFAKQDIASIVTEAGYKYKF